MSADSAAHASTLGDAALKSTRNLGCFRLTRLRLTAVLSHSYVSMSCNYSRATGLIDSGISKFEGTAIEATP